MMRGNAIDKWKIDHPFESRKTMTDNIRSKYPDRRPIIVVSGTNGLDLTKNKYLCPADSDMKHVEAVVRRRITDGLNEGETLYYLVNGKIMASPLDMIGMTYKQYAQDDGLLYIVVARDHAFGND